MAKTKNAIAREMYGCGFEGLYGAQRAAVTRRYNAQGTERATRAPRTTGSGDVCSVKFGRPGVNGVKEVLVAKGTQIETAFNQTGLTINRSKEGFVAKESNHYDEGQAVSPSDPVYDGDLYMIVPGVDSSQE